jgi:hypothetical protein
MSNFIQLSPPYKESPLSIWDGKWFVGAVDVNDGFLHNANATLVQACQNEDLYFDTESKAHAAAATYYHDHNITYPYHKEWDASINAPSADEEDEEDVITSQVMKFI